MIDVDNLKGMDFYFEDVALERETTFATRCVACDGPITGRGYAPIVSKYREYCPICQGAISSAKSAARAKQKATRRRMLDNEQRA